jgi:predicted P-loop ATPase
VLGVTMPPAGARFHGSLPKLGAPIHTAEYADGFKICAYLEAADPAIGRPASRRYMPWQWAAERQEYAQRALPDQPRPLYRPENLEHYPDAPVYVFEREDMVDAFNALSGDAPVIATTCAGGSGAFALGEWDALYGRTVVLWPTHVTDCEQAMQELARRLDKAGAHVSLVTLPQDLPQGWTLLNALESSWNWDQVEAFSRTYTRVLDRQVLPIASARIRANGAAPVAEPKRVKQSDPHAIHAQDTWARIPNLLLAKNNTPYSNMANVCAVIESFNGKYGDVWYDEFHCKVFTDEQNPRAWEDSDTLELLRILQHEIALAGVRPATVVDAVNQVAYRRKRHEVREWLNSLEWDEHCRLAALLPRGFGTETSPYCTHVGRCMLVAAVARIMRPGCQVDYVPVFEGPGGRGKTSALRILGGKWFDNPSAQMGEKDFLQNMTGKWILELAELANIRRHELEVIKAIITRTRDTYRAPYERKPAEHARQCVFAGTIDRSDWNTDEAGGRRWWPVTCGRIDLDWLAENRTQLFAEAAYRFREGEGWHEVPEQAAAAARRARVAYDAWTGRIAPYLESRTSTRPEDVLRFALDMELPEKWSAEHQRRVRRALKESNWIEQPDHSWKAPQ